MYTTNLTDAQWQVIKNFIADVERKRKHDLRNIFNAIFYILKTGCQWRMLPKEFPKWQLVYYYFAKWRDTEEFEYINDMLRENVRKKLGRNASPSAGIVDSQSVKTTRRGGLRGIDGNKKINGRKRHIVVDTLGFILAVIIHPANMHDSVGAELLLRKLKENFFGLKVIFADGGYRGELIEWAKNTLGYLLKIVMRTDNQKGFKVLPKRWIVERTFSWFENHRRLSKDFEYLLETSEAMIHLASIKLLLNKI
jgi:transposase